MWYWILRYIEIGVLNAFFRYRIEGIQHIPRKANFIIVSNHTSFLDPLVVMAAVPRKIYCITARYLYKVWWIRWFLGGTESFPVGCSSDKAASLLNKDKNKGLFPEGKCSIDGKLGDVSRGAALLALKTGRPILPCAILGAYQILPWGAPFPGLFRRLKVKIGSPIYLLKESEEIIDDRYLQEGIGRVKRKVQEMLDAG